MAKSNTASDPWEDYGARLRASRTSPSDTAGPARVETSSAVVAGAADDKVQADAAAPYCLAIVGTAGRRNDAVLLSGESFERMVQSARIVIRQRGYTHLVSGGAAWADHVAVALALEGDLIATENLTLHLPTPLVGGAYDNSQDGVTCNRYHRAFSRKVGYDTLGQVDRVISLGARAHVNPRGFKARNTDVANGCNAILAFTFGGGTPWKTHSFGHVSAERAQLNPLGTGTWDTWTKARVSEKMHVPLAPIKGAAVPRFGL